MRIGIGILVYIALAFHLLLVQSACNITTYYSSIPELFDTPPDVRDRDAWKSLINKLIRILVDTHIVVPYTSTAPDVWDALTDVDRDPNDDSKVKCIYSNVSLTNTAHGTTAFGQWNREHIWVKSFGIDTNGDDYSDVHNLVPAQAPINSARGDKPYDDCDASLDDSCRQPAYHNSNTGLISTPDSGTNTNGESLPRWMPPAYVRGFLARSNMYTALRYNGSGTDANTENLVLSACACKSIHAMGNLTSLLKWAEEEPVRQWEITRNDRVCSFWQHNRNPFTDFPWLTDMFRVRPHLEQVSVDCPETWTGSQEGVCDPTTSLLEPTPFPTSQPSPEGCTNGKVFSTCGSPCDATCENPDPICIEVCSTGCFCPQDRPIYDSKSNQCVISLEWCSTTELQSSCMVYPDENGHVVIGKTDEAIIPSGAFNECSELKSVFISAHVTRIGDSAFSRCHNLKVVTFEKGSMLSYVGSHAFYMTGLTSLSIPASVIELGVSSFEGCSALAEVTVDLGSALTTLGDNAFLSSGLGSGLLTVESSKFKLFAGEVGVGRFARVSFSLLTHLDNR